MSSALWALQSKALTNLISDNNPIRSKGSIQLDMWIFLSQNLFVLKSDMGDMSEIWYG